MMPQYAVSYVKTPLFFAQSFADGYQSKKRDRFLPVHFNKLLTSEIMFLVENIMALSCMPGSRNSENCDKSSISYLSKFRKSMLAMIKSTAPALSGYWIVSCTSHTITNHDYYWTTLKGASRSLRDTFTGWYEAYSKSLTGDASFHETVLLYIRQRHQ